MIPCFCRSALPRSAPAIRPADAFRGPSADDPAPVADRGPIIGVVVFPDRRGGQLEAILDDRGRWSCPRLPVLDRVLNILYEPGRVDGGASPFGHRALIQAAEWLKGEVRFRRPDDR